MTARDANAEKPDCTRACDQHVAAGERHDCRRMHGVAAGIEHSRVAVGYIIMHRPDVARRHHHTLGKRTGAVDSDDRCFATEVRATRTAEPAMSAGDVALAGDALPRRKMAHAFAHPRYAADEFMADHTRRLDTARRPFVPFPDMEIGAAYAGHGDANFHFARTGWGRVFHHGVAQARFGARFQDGEHGRPRLLRRANLSGKPAWRNAGNLRNGTSALTSTARRQRHQALALRRSS